MQTLSGLISYLLLAIYCQEGYNKKVNIKHLRELCIQIKNEVRELDNNFLQYQLGAQYSAKPNRIKLPLKDNYLL